MTPRRSWLEDSTGVVVDGGGRFDLVPSRIHVRELIRRRVTAVAMGLRDGAGVSPDLLGTSSIAASGYEPVVFVPKGLARGGLGHFRSVSANREIKTNFRR